MRPSVGEEAIDVVFIGLMAHIARNSLNHHGRWLIPQLAGLCMMLIDYGITKFLRESSGGEK